MYRDDGPTGGGIPPVKRPMQQCESQCAPSEVASVSSPVTYQQLKRVERPVASVRPSILRSGHRKRTHQMLQTDSAPVVPAASSSADEHLTRLNMPSLRQQPDPRGDAYVKQLVSKMSGRFESLVSTRKVSATQQSDSSVRKRLSTRKDCDLNALCCCVPLCGRSFDSLQVLAWHMSYAHQDVSISHSRNTICYLCGYQMFTAKGKNAHLTTKHRLIAERHNAECIEQRGSIIAPGAPAAERLRLKEVHRKTDAYAERRLTPQKDAGTSGYDRFAEGGTTMGLDSDCNPLNAKPFDLYANDHYYQSSIGENYGAYFVDLPVVVDEDEYD